MGIGIYELLILLVLIVVLIFGIVWLTRRNRSRSLAIDRPVADRLAELESLRRAGRITADEYEKQRTAIISSV